jgi:hypothetical protein
MSAEIIRFPVRPRPRPVEGWFEREMRAALDRIFAAQVAQYEDRLPADTEPDQSA